MLLTSAISGNKLVEFLSCIVGIASLSQLEIAGISLIHIPNRFVSQPDVKDNAARSNIRGGFKCQNSLQCLDADLLS